MGKRMKLPFFSKSCQAIPSWPRPSCGNPKTLSFRYTGDILKTVNPAFFDIPQCHGSTNRYKSRVSATCTKNDDTVGENACVMTRDQNQMLEPWLEGAVEEVLKGLRSEDRLFFDLEESRSIVGEGKNDNVPFKKCVAMVMDSRDPHVDFKKSMEEIVEAHGFRDWENFEKLLNWYLMVNEKNNHGYVIGAFVDLLSGLSFSSLSLGCSMDDNDVHGESRSSNYIQDSFSSPLSFSFSTISTSPCLSSLELVENDVEEEVDSGS